MASLTKTVSYFVRSASFKASTSRATLTTATCHPNLYRNPQHRNTSTVPSNSVEGNSSKNAQSFNHRAPGLKVSFNEHLLESPDLEASMALLNPRRITLDVALTMVKHMGEIVKQGHHTRLSTEQRNKLLNDKKFDQLSLVLHRDIDKIPLPDLLSSAECLLTITQDDLFLTKSIETQIIWQLRSMPVNLLIKVLTLHKEHRETVLRQEVWAQTLDILQTRYANIEKPQELISLFYVIGEEHPDLLSKLEERAGELCDRMSHKERSKILSLLSRRKQRNKPLISKLLNELNNKNLDLTSQQAQNLLLSCSNLQMYHKPLIGKTIDLIKANPKELWNVHVAIRLMSCLSGLRWLDEDLLDTLCRTLIQKIDSVTYNELQTMLLTCAKLDCLPQTLSENLGLVIDRLGLEDCNGKKWVDVVWSLAVLRCLNSDLLATLTDPKFLSSLEATPGKEIADLKLRNIASAAHHELRQKLPLPDQTTLTVPVRQKRMLLTSVIQSLSSFAPPDRYLMFDVSHPSGFTIDIELAINNAGQPVPKDAIPESGIHRLAIKVLDFPDMTLNKKTPTGLLSMAIRHLGYHGYRVIQIPFTEFQALSTEVQRVQYIERKIKQSTQTN